MSPSMTIEQVRELKPCPDAFRRIQRLLVNHSGGITAEQARAAGCSFGDIVWVASAVARNNPDVERRLRLFTADCAARVLHVFENEDPGNDRPRQAIVAARQFARGEIDAAARAVAWEAAQDAAQAAAWDAARAAGYDAARDAAWDAAWDAEWDAVWGAAWGAAWDAEQEWQFTRLIERLSDQEPEDWPLPEPMKGAD